MSQSDKIIQVLRKNKNGVPNYKFPEMRILDYTARISELRKDGYNIVAERQKLPNGRSTNVFLYYLIEDKKGNLEYEKSSFFKRRFKILG